MALTTNSAEGLDVMTLPKSVFIVGWYGTETVGDKAILGGIINEYKNISPNIKIVISSIYPFVTRQTLRELGMEAQVVPAYDWQFIKASASCDEVVMGGGPLMDLESLSIPLWSFLIARLFGKKRIIKGCGLGPLTRAKYINAVRRILILASEIYLRDSDSVRWATRLCGRDDIRLVSDPAKEYILSCLPAFTGKINSSQKILACFLREWPQNYAASSIEYAGSKSDFERNLAGYLVAICRKYDLRLILYSMHTFSVGGDDREFNRRFISNHIHEVDVEYDPKPSSVNGILQAMLAARLCFCMRYHSVLFAHTLKRDYVAVDYTNGGKIPGFLKDENAQDRCATVQEIASGELQKLNALIACYFRNET